MQTQVKKWGNSLALRIPKPLAEQLAIKTDTEVEIVVEDGQLLIRPLPEPALTLEELLAQITDENLHNEVETGTAVGSEVW
ncbi:AbrB/MazE/SpoVT family DNA-binding domain-containing protein [Candidatus Leptofilum sp.]|uniref:AbrB/MazE/SpoVT family DNA-binding domain-containing protein n=1 Tax=Candidatus Leptofilum sp. TaxID=3241576 RepID=UPI003B5CD8DC